MIFKYGSYTHDAAELTLTIRREPVFCQGNFESAYKESWQGKGFLQAADQAALTTAINALQAAYATHGQNATLYLADGTTATSHALVSANSYTGVRVTQHP